MVGDRAPTFEEARQKVESGSALLVCGYDKDEKFHKMHLQGAISLNELRTRQESFQRTRRSSFTEPDPQRGVPSVEAAEFREQGFTRTDALLGGVEGGRSQGSPSCD